VPQLPAPCWIQINLNATGSPAVRAAVATELGALALSVALVFTPNHLSPMASEIQKLDREKDFLLKEASTCSGAVRELDRKLEHLRQRRDEKIRAMAQASAMFLHGKEKERAELVMKDSKGRDIKKVVVVQPMGRRDAVAQTRRRIAKQADQLRKERSAIEARYNRMKMRIMKLKQSIDGARREGIIFDKTFASVHEDLLQVKRDIS